jgi:hypothetical protein
MINEAFYPVGFSIDELKSKNSFVEKIRYCNTHLKRIGSGSARIVYDIDGYSVLKLAKNRKGLAQNEVECDSYLQNYDVVARIYDYDEKKYLFIEMEKAQKLTKNKFKEINKFSFDNYIKVLSNAIRENNGYKPKHVIDENIISVIKNSDFFSDITKLIFEYDLPFGDLGRLSTYGIVKDRDGNNRLVLVDYGLTKYVYEEFYTR